GRMTILESRPGESIKIKLEFLKPFETTNTTVFAFKPKGDGTHVDWTMSGENDHFVKKAFALVMNMDKMVGKDFEKGLASLKSIVEEKG
ncbi:MAG: SRPBCC family protein, partial [Candidatus Omnitrophica bacterium]|nr:SRPBCC family protein [Candidatus Omnitrophota bacterium]